MLSLSCNGTVEAARRVIVTCVFSHFCVDFQSSVLPSLTLACASCRRQCEGTFCFAIFCRVFDVLPSEDLPFCRSRRRSLTVDPFNRGGMSDKHGVYGRRELLSLYSAALAPSHDVQSCLRSVGLWTVMSTEGRPRLPLPWLPGRSSTPTVANDAPSRQRRLRHNRKSPDHTCMYDGRRR